MGHYRSEMDYGAEDERRAKAKRETRKRMAAQIRKSIDKEGIEYVLADIIRDPEIASIRFNR